MKKEEGVTTKTTYCRLCAGFCGLLVDVKDSRVIRAKGDRDHPISRGYYCSKGRFIADFSNDPERFLQCQRRGAGGAFEPITAETAMKEVGARLREIVDRHGPDSVAVYWGTAASITLATAPWAAAFIHALGSRKWFSVMTVSQAPKWVWPGRIGRWTGGRQRFDDANVWMFVGRNPIISKAALDFQQTHGVKSFRDAKKRGVKMVVIDPRKTTLAELADIHLQIRPGTDAVVLAGLLNVILSEGLEDSEFCAQWVEKEGLAALHRAVAEITPDYVARVADISSDDVVAAARAFATVPIGMVSTGTGTCFSAFSNLVEHLAWCLNIVCGRFARAGDFAGSRVLSAQPGLHGMSAPPPRAQVAPPERTWEQGYRSRLGYGLVGRNMGSVAGGDLPMVSLPDEILEPGPDKVRALIVMGGNPISAIPDQAKTVRAFKELELIVTFEPTPSETARLADYVLSPALTIERPEHTGMVELIFGKPFAQYTDAIVPPPEGILEDWEYIAGIAAEMGLTLEVAGRTYGPQDPRPTPTEFIEMLAENGRVPLEEVKRYPHGHIFEELEPERVAPPDDTSGRFQLLSDDVKEELSEALRAGAPKSDRPFLFAGHRVVNTLNSAGKTLPRLAPIPYNPCSIHPDDMSDLALTDGDLVRIESDWGSLVAVAEKDGRTKRGVVAMAPGYGDLPGQDKDPRRRGANPLCLMTADENIQPIVGMPRLSAVPVTLEKVVSG